MRDTTQQSFASASDAIKQLLTLGTAILTLTIAFKDKIMPPPSSSLFMLIVLAVRGESRFSCFQQNNKKFGLHDWSR